MTTRLDAAVLAHRQDPTPDTRAALMAAAKAHNVRFRQRRAAELVRMNMSPRTTR